MPTPAGSNVIVSVERAFLPSPWRTIRRPSTKSATRYVNGCCLPRNSATTSYVVPNPTGSEDVLRDDRIPGSHSAAVEKSDTYAQARSGGAATSITSRTRDRTRGKRTHGATKCPGMKQPRQRPASWIFARTRDPLRSGLARAAEDHTRARQRPVRDLRGLGSAERIPDLRNSKHLRAPRVRISRGEECIRAAEATARGFLQPPAACERREGEAVEIHLPERLDVEPNVGAAARSPRHAVGDRPRAALSAKERIRRDLQRDAAVACVCLAALNIAATSSGRSQTPSPIR